LPDMALGLMERQKVDRLYWRVLGRTAQTGKTGTSQALPFSIHLPPGARPNEPADSAKSLTPPRPAPGEVPGSRPAPPPAAPAPPPGPRS
jgi:hypothetical protein